MLHDFPPPLVFGHPLLAYLSRAMRTGVRCDCPGTSKNPQDLLGT